MTILRNQGAGIINLNNLGSYPIALMNEPFDDSFNSVSFKIVE